MLYSDINSFTPTKISQVTDLETIYQALITLFNTRPGEEIFNPEYGLSIEDYLFELMDEGNSLILFEQIKTAITRWESRVIIDLAKSKIIPFPDENRYELELYFNVIGLGDNTFQLTGNITQ